ncbi:MAG: hypothetical protein M3296_00235 [Actinomycetota bacterium]|nr:hypothetical protein [Actinomycetota bacterium]
MVERSLRLLAIVLSAIVAVSFLLFALDESRRASDAQRVRLASAERPHPTRAGELLRERRQGTVRETIDDADDVLLAPFAGAVRSGGRWTERGGPALLALLVYGCGLGFLARLAHGRP